MVDWLTWPTKTVPDKEQRDVFSPQPQVGCQREGHDVIVETHVPGLGGDNGKSPWGHRSNQALYLQVEMKVQCCQI